MRGAGKRGFGVEMGRFWSGNGCVLCENGVFLEWKWGVLGAIEGVTTQKYMYFFGEKR